MRNFKLFSIISGLIILSMCVPPANTEENTAQDKRRLDSLRKVRCPRLMSSAAEYYRNRDWKVSNRGRRLDHIWLSDSLVSSAKKLDVYKETRDWEKPSDHVPVVLEIEI